MSTQWYYAVEGTSVGPVSQSEFDRLVATGAIRRDTLIWQEGMEDWLPYGRTDDAGADDALLPPTPADPGDDPARADANTFLGALKDGFARYVDFKTRSTRSQFWWWTLWMLLLGIGTAMINAMLSMGNSGPVNLVVSLGTFVPSIAVSVRRLHDIGRSGWWFLIVFIPLVGWIVLIVFHCTKTLEEPNKWGMPPRRI